MQVADKTMCFKTAPTKCKEKISMNLSNLVFGLKSLVWLVCWKKSRFKNRFEKNYIENFKLIELARMLNFSTASLSTSYTGRISDFL